MPPRSTTLTVPSTRGPYRVVIGTGAIRRLPQRLAGAGGRRASGNTVVVSCEPVWRRHAARLGPLARHGQVVLLTDGERAKTLTSVRRILEACVDAQVDRQGTIVAFGGGVVGDVAGFAAATYLRGIRLVQVPTTLLAQVDSAIGGKVGVNLPAGKNLVGAFYAPDLVLCDPDVLSTLSDREYRAGMYEVVKYGVIASSRLFQQLETHLERVVGRDPAVLTPLIRECCRIKADVVTRDEREAGPRRALNFGHTIGHALEAVTRYRRFRHGEAVAYGMRAAAALSSRRRAMSTKQVERLLALLDRMGPLPPVDDLDAAAILDAVRHDKKVVNRRLHFVLARGFGATSIVSDVTTAELRAALRTIGIR